MELSELKNKAFDIRAEIDKIDAGIQKANEQKAKLINEYNPIAQEIFKIENEAKQEAKPELKVIKPENE
jgi:peptidoglycan hydrolase CwlO-like protein